MIVRWMTLLTAGLMLTGCPSPAAKPDTDRASAQPDINKASTTTKTAKAGEKTGCSQCAGSCGDKAEAEVAQNPERHFGAAFTKTQVVSVSKAIAQIQNPSSANEQANCEGADTKDQKGQTVVAKSPGNQADSAEVTSCGSLANQQGDAIRMAGTIKSVCQKAGCWLVLEEGGNEVRIFTKKHGFFLPTDIAGRKAQAEGTLRERKISRTFAKHLAEDAGKDPKTAELPSREYIMTASSVSLL